MTSGCELVNVVNDIVTCQCNHLTNFAIFDDGSDNTSHAMTTVTWVGCAISITGLTVTIVTYLNSR